MNPKEKTSLKRYVLSLRRPGGGFSYAATLSATLEDTYYAVKLLEALCVPYTDKKQQNT